MLFLYTWWAQFILTMINQIFRYLLKVLNWKLYWEKYWHSCYIVPRINFHNCIYRMYEYMNLVVMKTIFELFSSQWNWKVRGSACLGRAALIALNWQYPGAKRSPIGETLRPAEVGRWTPQGRPRCRFLCSSCRNTGLQPRITLLSLHSSKTQSASLIFGHAPGDLILKIEHEVPTIKRFLTASAYIFAFATFYPKRP